MRYRLRALLILLAVGPPILAGAWYERKHIYNFAYNLFVPSGIKGLEADNGDGTRTVVTFRADGTIERKVLPSSPTQTNSPQEPRPMFRFTIRDVLWLTALVAMGLGWRLDHRQITPEDRETLKLAKALGITFGPFIYPAAYPADGTSPTMLFSLQDGPWHSVPWRTVGSPQSAALGRPRFLSHDKSMSRCDGQPVLVNDRETN